MTYELYESYESERWLMADDAMIETIQLSNARSELSRLYDEAVEQKHPVVIQRRGDEDAVLWSRAQLANLVADAICHVTFMPEDEGGITIWAEELVIGAHGPTLREARDAFVATVRRYVKDYFARHEFYRNFTDKAAQLPYVTRLSLARDDKELRHLLFAPILDAPLVPHAPDVVQ